MKQCWVRNNGRYILSGRGGKHLSTFPQQVKKRGIGPDIYSFAITWGMSFGFKKGLTKSHVLQATAVVGFKV